MEASLPQPSVSGIAPVTLSAPSGVLPTLIIGLPGVSLPYRFSVEAGHPAEKASTAALLEESLDLDNDIETIDLNAPIVRTPKVDRHVQFFSFQIRDRFEQWLNRLERHRPMVQSIFTEFNLPLDLIFLSLVESGFNTNAVSRAKAVGPWQFIKPTAKTYGLRVDNWIDERRDPVKSTVAAAHYLRDLYHLFGSWPLAMAAYNAGERKVGRALTRTQGADFWDLTDTKLLKRETKEYVPRFLAATMIAKDPDRFGLIVTPQTPVEYEEVVLTRPIHLRTAAKAAGVSYEEMKSLNPELRKDVTPPDPVYHLKVPVGSKSALIDNLSMYAQEKNIQAVRYQIRRGDTLPLLASRHGVTTEAIQQANDLEKSYKPKTGDWLLLPKPAKAVTIASQEPAKISR
jgi:membrane-bound lytic murein transglycosylase D